MSGCTIMSLWKYSSYCPKSVWHWQWGFHGSNWHSDVLLNHKWEVLPRNIVKVAYSKHTSPNFVFICFRLSPLFGLTWCRGKELVGITCSFLALHPAGETSPCHVKRKQPGLLMYIRKHEISPLLPQVGWGSVTLRITLDNWHWVKMTYKIMG